MPTRVETNFARPKSKDEFERLICDICRLEWHDPGTDLRGRSGQKQLGVDVYGQPEGLGGIYRAAQCKLRTKNTQLTQAEIEKEVEDAKRFPHKLDRLIIATDAPRDTNTQDIINAISEREQRGDGFRIDIWFWEAICLRIASYSSVMIRYYADYFANLTSLPIVERLVDKPLQLLAYRYPPSGSLSDLEEALVLRGIRFFGPNSLSRNRIEELLPDGVLLQYAEPDPSEVMRFSSQVSAHLNRQYPIFAVINTDEIDNFYIALQTLGVRRDALHIFTSDQTLNVIASAIFENLFSFGYQRRGSLATIDITVRCSSTRPTATHLDVNWESRLTTRRFPLNDEWENLLLPAANDILRQITKQGDRTRLQIRPILPLPAAIAWGYLFNLRVVRLGVWARHLGVSDFRYQFWLSDGESSELVLPQNWIISPAGEPRSAIVEMTNGADIHRTVQDFVIQSQIAYDAWLQVGAGSTDPRMRNIDEGVAVAYANEIGRILREISQLGITEIHLFLRMPSALAILIGQRLQACGRIHLYWFVNPSYRYAFTLK